MGRHCAARPGCFDCGLHAAANHRASLMAWTVVRDALLLLVLASFAYYAVAIVATLRFFGGRDAAAAWAADFTPPISILKPIYGLDRETYENYASFCMQDYPDYEIIFCVSDEQDAAIPVIAKLASDFPQHRINLLIGSEPLGVSDKVNKLCRMAREARYEILAVSDSDVRVEPEYLRALAARLPASIAGLPTARSPQILKRSATARTSPLECWWRGFSLRSISLSAPPW